MLTCYRNYARSSNVSGFAKGLSFRTASDAVRNLEIPPLSAGWRIGRDDNE